MAVVGPRDADIEQERAAYAVDAGLARVGPTLGLLPGDEADAADP